MKKIINIIGFYVILWSCMLGASNDLPYLGPMVMVVLLIAHRFLFVRNIKEIYNKLETMHDNRKRIESTTNYL